MILCIGPLLPKEPVIFPVPQLQLPGPLTAFQPQPGCGDQQQLPGNHLLLEFLICKFSQ